MKLGMVYLGFSTDFFIEEADEWRDESCKDNGENREFQFSLDNPFEYARLTLDGECRRGWMRLIVWKAGDFMNNFVLMEYLELM